MGEMRWDPVRKEWVATATVRMDRPQMPKDWCPFCPGSGNVPDQYDVHLYPNDFPTFSTPPPPQDLVGDDFYRTEESFGYCDVVLYHPDHTTVFSDLTDGHLRKLTDLWVARYKELCADEHVKFVYIFENNGEAIGVTMPHPHGQIYSFPMIPPVIQQELSSSAEYFEENGRCLHCDIVKRELDEKARIIFEDDVFVAFIPFWARWPFEIHMYTKKHFAHIAQFGDAEKNALGPALRRVVKTYNAYFGFPPGYMMVMHQTPTGLPDERSYHFHVEFYPVNRSRTKLKYRAGCETGAGTFINDSQPEEKAAELREYVVY